MSLHVSRQINLNVLALQVLVFETVEVKRVYPCKSALYVLTLHIAWLSEIQLQFTDWVTVFNNRFKSKSVT